MGSLNAGRLNVGVIGLGRMGSVYARNLAQRVPNARLAAVSDHKPDLLEHFGAELAGVKVYASHLDLLQDKNVEALVVVTSTSAHKQVVLDAVASGKAIFCEKPMALSLQDAYEMQSAIEKAGVFFQMGSCGIAAVGWQAARQTTEWSR